MCPTRACFFFFFFRLSAGRERVVGVRAAPAFLCREHTPLNSLLLLSFYISLSLSHFFAHTRTEDECATAGGASAYIYHCLSLSCSLCVCVSLRVVASSTLATSTSQLVASFPVRFVQDGEYATFGSLLVDPSPPLYFALAHSRNESLLCCAHRTSLLLTDTDQRCPARTFRGSIQLRHADKPRV